MYKVTFKGDRSHENIDNEAGAKLYEMKKQGTLPNHVELRDGLLVPSKTIKDIEHIPDATEKRQYSETELMRFANEELHPYLKDGYLTQIGEILYYQAKGMVIYTGPTEDVSYAPSYYISVVKDRVKEFGDLQDKVHQYKFLLGRKYLAQKREAAELDSLRSREAPRENFDSARLCECGCGRDLNEASKEIGYHLTRFATSACVRKSRLREATKATA